MPKSIERLEAEKYLAECVFLVRFPDKLTATRILGKLDGYTLSMPSRDDTVLSVMVGSYSRSVLLHRDNIPFSALPPVVVEGIIVMNRFAKLVGEGDRLYTRSDK